jgi:SAM-dependent methyltransferase
MNTKTPSLTTAKDNFRRLIRALPGGSLFLRIRWRLIVFADGVKTRILRRLVPSYRRQRGTFQEINHWSKVLASREVVRADPDYSKRVDPNRILQPELVALLPRGVLAPTVLDVGSGPLSTVGIVAGEIKVTLTGADPLAADYLKMLKDIGIEPNCKLFGCTGEELIANFGAASFDLVACVNAMDHSEDPIEVFRQMAEVCKPGGYLYLYHAEDEGYHERYHGMHQWNFSMQRGKPVLNDGRKTFNLLEATPGVSMVTSRRLPRGDRHALEWIFKRRS